MGLESFKSGLQKEHGLYSSCFSISIGNPTIDFSVLFR